MHTNQEPAKEVPRKYPYYLKLLQLGFRWLGPLFPSLAGKIAFQLFTTPRSRARHIQTDEIIKSATSFELPFQPHRIKVYVWGKGAKTALLLHGWESRGTALRSFIPKLVAQNYCVTTFDAPAHGDSSGNRLNLLLYSQSISKVLSVIGRVDALKEILVLHGLQDGSIPLQEGKKI